MKHIPIPVLHGAVMSVVMPLTDQEYGRAFGVADPSGNDWWITSVKN